MTLPRSQPEGASAMEPWVADAVRIADTYLAGAPIEYRKQCAGEIIKAIVDHASGIAMDAIKVATGGRP